MRKLIALFLSLALLCTALSAGAEFVSSARNRISIGEATYSIPADFVSISQGERSISAAYGDYHIVIEAMDYRAAGLAERMADAGAQVNNAGFLLMLAGYDSTSAGQLLQQFVAVDLGLPCGENSLAYGSGAGVILFHYCEGIGTEVVVTSEARTVDELLDIGARVMRSLIVEEKAEATAEEATAERYVVITNASANVRSGPDPESEKLFIAYQGEIYLCLGMVGNWYMIDANGQTGYVTSSLAALQE